MFFSHIFVSLVSPYCSLCGLSPKGGDTVMTHAQPLIT